MSCVRLLAVVVLLFGIGTLSAQQRPRLDADGETLPDGALARLGMVRLRTRVPAAQLRFAPDGKTLATIADGGTLHLWDVTTGRELRWFQRGGTTPAVRQSDPTQQLLQVRGIVVWQNELNEVGGGSSAGQTTDLSADARFVAVWENGVVQIWDTGSHKKIREWAVEGERGAVPVAFSGDGKTLATLETEKEVLRVVVVDLATGKPGHILKLPRRASPTRLQFVPGDKELLGIAGPFVYIWDLKTSKRVRSYQAEGAVTALAVSVDGKTLVAATNHGTVHLWDNSSLDEQAHFKVEDRIAQAVACAPDGKTIALAMNDNIVRLWDTSTGKATELSRVEAPITAFAFAPDGKTLAWAAHDGRVRLWDLDKGEARKVAHDEIATCCFANQGKSILVQTTQGELLQHDNRTYKVEQRQKALAKAQQFKALSGDGRFLAVVGENATTVTIHDLSEQKVISTLKGHDNQPNLLRFSPDGTTLLTREGGTRTMRLWNFRTGQELRRLDRNLETGLISFSPSGRMIAAHEEDRVYLWEVASGKRRGQFRVGNAQAVLTFSPDERSLFVGGADEVVRQWDVVQERLVRGFLGHDGAVQHVHVSADGKRLATASDDKTVRVWDIATGEQQGSFTGHRDRVRQVEFHRDGKSLLSLGEDGIAYVWDTSDLKARRPASGKLPPIAMQQLWLDLKSEEAETAFAAMKQCTRQPEDALLLFAEQIKPAAAATADELAKLIADLDHPTFQTRVRAQRSLEMLEGQAVEALRKALSAQPAVDAERRIKEILARADQPASGNESLRQLRALETVVWIGTPEAKRLIEKWSKGAPGARLTIEAKAALERWQ